MRKLDIRRFNKNTDTHFIHKNLILPVRHLIGHGGRAFEPYFNVARTYDTTVFNTVDASTDLEYLPNTVKYYAMIFDNGKNTACVNFSLQRKKAKDNFLMPSTLGGVSDTYHDSFGDVIKDYHDIILTEADGDGDHILYDIMDMLVREYSNEKKYTDEVRKAVGHGAMNWILNTHRAYPNVSIWDLTSDEHSYQPYNMNVAAVQPTFNFEKVLGYECGDDFHPFNPDKEVMLLMDENCFLQNNQNRNYDAELYNVVLGSGGLATYYAEFLTDDIIKNKNLDADYILDNNLYSSGHMDADGHIISHISRFWLPLTHRFVY